MFEFNDRLLSYQINDKQNGLISITYKVSYINTSWDIVLQCFEYCSYIGKYMVVESHFLCYDILSNQPTTLSGSAFEKAELWNIIFEIKRYYYDQYKPPIIKHFIDGSYSFKKRLKRYQKNLQIKGYEYFSTEGARVFYLIRLDIIDEVIKMLEIE